VRKGKEGVQVKAVTSDVKSGIRQSRAFATGDQRVVYVALEREGSYNENP
jgi:hypothetical protein